MQDTSSEHKNYMDMFYKMSWVPENMLQDLIYLPFFPALAVGGVLCLLYKILRLQPFSFRLHPVREINGNGFLNPILVYV